MAGPRDAKLPIVLVTLDEDIFGLQVDFVTGSWRSAGEPA